MEQIPHDKWVINLRKGNVVWLTKEQKEAKIAYPYEIEPGFIAGDVGIEISPGYIQKWYIRANGKGLDFGQLIWPIEGHVPENPPELPDNDIRKFNREIDSLHNRVDCLWKVVQSIIDPLCALTIADVVLLSENLKNPIDFFGRLDLQVQAIKPKFDSDYSSIAFHPKGPNKSKKKLPCD